MYIDLFVIIPVAVSSECLEILQYCDIDGRLISGPHTPLSHGTPQKTHSEPCVKERPCEHHRPDYHYKRNTILGIFLGAAPTLVCVINVRVAE